MARNQVIDLRRNFQPQQQSPIVSGLEGLMEGLSDQEKKKKRKEDIVGLLVNRGYDQQKAEAYSDLDDTLLKFALSQDEKREENQRKRQKFEQGQEQYAREKQGREAEDIAVDEQLAQAPHMTPEQKKIYKGLRTPKARSDYIKTITPNQNIFGKYLSPAPHPLAPGPQSQFTEQNIEQVVQQLKERGMQDEEIAQLLQDEMKTEQQEQGPFDPMRALGGAATSAAGMGGMKALSNIVPGAGQGLFAYNLAELGLSGLNKIAKGLGYEGDAFPSIAEKMQNFREGNEQVLNQINQQAAQAIEKRTGTKPEVKPVKLPEPPLKSLLDITQGVRDVAKSFGFDTEPRTPGEKKVANAAGAFALLFDPKNASKSEIAKALKIAGVQVGTAEGLGALGKVITGSDLVDKGMTFAGYVLASRYPDAINKYKTEQYKKWNEAVDKGKDTVIPAAPITKKLDEIEHALNKGDPFTDSKKYAREKIIGTVRNAKKAGKYSPEDLEDVYHGLNDIYETSKDNKVMKQWNDVKGLVNDQLENWASKNAPDALESFRTANSIHSAQQNTSAIADSIRKAAGGGFLSVNPARLALKLVGKPAANVIEEISSLFTNPGMRSAYYNLIKAGAKNNPEVIGTAARRLAAAIKHQDKSLYDKLTKS